MHNDEWTQLRDALASLSQQVARLNERVTALEAAATTPPPTPADADVSEELILVMSAAIAAFLGKTPHIRQVRLVGSGSWAQQGRATIQASHALSVQHH